MIILDNVRSITVFGATGSIGSRVLDQAIDKGIKPRAFTRNIRNFKWQTHYPTLDEVLRLEAEEEGTWVDASDDEPDNQGEPEVERREEEEDEGTEDEGIEEDEDPVELLPGEVFPGVEVYAGSILEPNDVDDAIQGSDAVVIALGTMDSLKPTTDLSEGTKNIINAMKKYKVKAVSVCLSCCLFPEEETPALFKNVAAEHQRMYDALKESGLNYIAVFAPNFTFEEPGGKLVITINGTKSPGRLVSERSVAKFLVDCLNRPKYYKTVIGLTNDP